MKYILIALLFICASAKAQFPAGTDTLRNYNNRFIDNDPRKAFTNLRLHNLLAGMINYMDSIVAGNGINIGMDTAFMFNDSLFTYRKGGVFTQFVIRGSNPAASGAGAIYRVPFNNGLGQFANDSNFKFDKSVASDAARLIVGPTSVSSGGYAKINATSDNMNALGLTSYGTGLNTIIARRARGSIISPTALQSDDDLFNLSGRGHNNSDFTTSRAAIYARATQNWNADSNGTAIHIATTPNHSDVMADRVIINDSVQVAMSPAGSSDSIAGIRINPNGLRTLIAIPAPSGSTNLDTSRTSSSVTISSSTGSDAVILGANETKAGALTAVDQTIAGNKTHTGPRTNFQGYSPILNTQYSPSQVVSDSIFNNRYIGFGGIDILPDGTLTIVYTDSHNHIGDSAFLKLAKSTNQGRSFTTDTLLRISGDTSVSMGGMGVSPSGRLIVFYYKFTTSAQHGLFIIYSDNEGETWSAPYQISNLSHPIYNPYGGLVKIADNKLLFSWYGYTLGGDYKSYVITSSDDGETWSSSVEVYSNPAIKPTETMFTHLGGGYILGLARSDGTAKYTQLVSTDNGVTWDSVGHVAFGHEGTPAWLKTYIDEVGKRVVVAYYRYSPTVATKEIHAIYGYADSLIVNGVNGWDLSTEKTLVDSVDGSGYISIVHPNDGPGGTGYFYDENDPQFRSALKFLRVPLSNVPPIGPRGIFGLTANRIAISADDKTLTDYNLYKVNTTNRSIVLNNSTVPDWLGYNAGVIETAKASIALNDDDGSIALLNNGYVNTDFKYKSNAAGGLFAMTSGRLHFYNAPSGSAGGVMSLSERFSVRANGDVWFNNSPGTADYVLTSGGSGNPTTYQVTKNMATTDLTLTGNRSHNGAGYNYALTGLGDYNLQTSGTYFSTRTQQSQIRTLATSGASPFKLRYALLKADLSADSILAVQDMNLNGFLFTASHAGTGKNSTMEVGTDGVTSINGDSVRLKLIPHSGSGLPDSVVVPGWRQLTGSTELGTSSMYVIPRSALFPTVLRGSTTWDPASIGANSSTTTTVSVTGAALGDQVLVSKTSGSFSNGEIYFGYVSSSGQVTIQLQNGSGATFDIASADYNIMVLKQ